MSKSQIESLLRDTTVQLKALEKSEERFARELAPNFRPFDLFRVDEMTVSRCLASLLDPKGKHGQGPLFLESFLELFGLKDRAVSNGDTKISTEFHAGAPGRIDILLELDGFAIAIENKPWAAYGDNQLGRYADWLKSRGDGVHWALICLTNEDPPDTALNSKTRKDLERDGHYMQIDFWMIEKWLDGSALQSRAASVRIFVGEFSKYIRFNVNGALEMEEVKEIERLIKDTENLKSAVAIANAWPEIRKQKLKKFIANLDRDWKGNHVGNSVAKVLHWGLNEERAGAWFGFLREPDQSLLPCFAFSSTGLNDLYWGVSTRKGAIPDEHKAAAARIHELLNEEFGIEGSKNQYWAWYTYADRDPMDDRFRNWQVSSQPWLELNEGKLVDKLDGIAIRIYQKLSDEPTLLQGKLE